MQGPSRRGQAPHMHGTKVSAKKNLRRGDGENQRAVSEAPGPQRQMDRWDGLLKGVLYPNTSRWCTPECRPGDCGGCFCSGDVGRLSWGAGLCTAHGPELGSTRTCFFLEKTKSNDMDIIV